MKPNRQRFRFRSGRPAWRSRAAFSLIEIMVAVSLLAVIVLGLLAMFDQTQKAFRGSMTQTDVLESGRSLREMMSREVAQIIPSGVSNTINIFVGFDKSIPSPRRFLQGLPGESVPQAARTNVTERFFFLTCINQHWTAYDYQVQPELGLQNIGVGSLYRCVMNSTVPAIPQPAQSFNNYATNVSRVADGIVHFRVRAYDTNGTQISSLSSRGGPAWTTTLDPASGEQMFQFWSNALPASLEVEFAILEPEVLAKFRALAAGPKPALAKNYLSNQVGRAHLFRQRIPLRNADSGVSP